MKIGYLCIDPGIPVFGRKGCSTHVRETCRALKSAGNEVFLITTNKGEDDCEIDGIKIYEIPPLTSKILGNDVRLFINSMRTMNSLKEIIQKEKPDALYERHSLYNFAGTRISQKYHLPRILESNTFLVVEQENRVHFPFIAAKFENYAIRKAPHIIVVSHPLKNAYINMGIPADKVSIMPMAVDIERFNPEITGEDVRKKYNLDNTTIVGYVGTLTGWHGIDLILDCAETTKKFGKNISYIVVGGHDKKVDLFKDKVQERGLEAIVVFTGSVPYTEIPKYIAAMDITLVPNSTEWASPTKIFEYQAMSKPIVAPSLVPVREVIKDSKEGLLFELKNTNEMAEKIIYLHDHPEIRKEMGISGRKRVVANHSWEVNTSRIVDIFQKMLDGELPY